MFNVSRTRRFPTPPGTCVNGGVQSPCGRRRTRPSSISTGTVGGIEVLIDRNLNPKKIKKTPKNGCLFNTACVP
ncbi:hypothetical protein CIG17_00450 [Escherichia coli]|nr:hypothetical protein CIG17_00450 [Escherichia coli]